MLYKSKYAVFYRTASSLIYYNTLNNQQVPILAASESIPVGEEWNCAVLSEILCKSTLDQLLMAQIFLEMESDECTPLNNFILQDWSEKKTLHVTILPTDYCNFQCKYCYQNHNMRRMSETLVASILQFIINQLPSIEALHLSWFGGEPLCAIAIVKSAMRRISICAALFNVSLNASMVTNAYLLTPQAFSSLYSYGLYGYQVTLDGPAWLHNSLRPLKDGTGTFDRIIENLLYIKNNPQFDKARVLIRINTTQALLPILPEFIRYLGNLFGKDMRFSVDIEQATDLGGSTIDGIRENLIDGSLNSAQFLDLLQANNLNSYNSSAFRLGSNLCNARKNNSFVFSPDGTVHKCTAALYDEINNIGYIDSCGIHLNDDKVSMWANPPICESANTCAYFPLCFGHPCPYAAIRYNQTSCPIDSGKIDIKAMLKGV